MVDGSARRGGAGEAAYCHGGHVRVINRRRVDRSAPGVAKKRGLVYLIPAALFLSLMGLVAFFWSLHTGQYDDLDGSAERILFDEDED